MIRLRVKEFVEQNASGLNMTSLARRAGIAQTTIIKIWKSPENTDFVFSKLEAIAKALSEYLGRYVSTKELYDDSPDTPGNVVQQGSEKGRN
jgi:predicted transcriptional regulator